MINYFRRFSLSVILVRLLSRFIDKFEKPWQRGGSRWLYPPYAKIYIRLSRRILEFTEDPLWCLDVASIEIAQPYQRKGFGEVAFGAMEYHAQSRGIGAIFVECIHNDHLYEWLVRRGYKPAGLDAQSLYKRLVTK